MSDVLLKRFAAEIAPLRYADRQRIKRGKHAVVARERIVALERRIWWERVSTAFTVALLLAFAAMVVFMQAVVEITHAVAFLIATFFGAEGLRRIEELKRKRMLCELVVAQADAEDHALRAGTSSYRDEGLVGESPPPHQSPFSPDRA
jgi:hypothetical protein